MIARGLALVLFACAAVAEDATELFEQAQAAYSAGDTTKALGLMDQAIAAEPGAISIRSARARLREIDGQFAKAAEDYGFLIEKQPAQARLYLQRGSLWFFAGEIAKSIDDFDQVAKLEPQREAHLWQRGISHYYAGRFKDGRKQFEIHKAVNPHDVENAAWHFICVARDEGVEAARKVYIPIETARDTRVPMKEIFELFGGLGTVQDVLDRVADDDPKTPRGRNHHCYAQLYLGLWYEVNQEAEKAFAAMKASAVTHKMDHYMGQVAQVHYRRMLKERKE